jgi:hypothetical protein
MCSWHFFFFFLSSQYIKWWRHSIRSQVWNDSGWRHTFSSIHTKKNVKIRETPTKKKAVKHESVLASGAGMSAFLLKESGQTEITAVRVSSHFLVGTETLMPVSLPLPLSSPPFTSAHERTKERTNEGTNQTNRKERAKGQAFFIPAWFRRLSSHAWLDPQVCGGQNETLNEESERVETSWDGTESQSERRRRHPRIRGACERSVSHWDANGRHFWFQLCVDLYSNSRF